MSLGEYLAICGTNVAYKKNVIKIDRKARISPASFTSEQRAEINRD